MLFVYYCLLNDSQTGLTLGKGTDSSRVRAADTYSTRRAVTTSSVARMSRAQTVRANDDNPTDRHDVNTLKLQDHFLRVGACHPLLSLPDVLVRRLLPQKPTFAPSNRRWMILCGDTCVLKSGELDHQPKYPLDPQTVPRILNLYVAR